MAFRLAVLVDIHGNLAALEAVLRDIKRQRPDQIAVLGDHVFHGPRPADVVEGLRALQSGGGLVVGCNTYIAVTDYDYTAACPRIHGAPSMNIAAAESAREQLSD